MLLLYQEHGTLIELILHEGSIWSSNVESECPKYMGSGFLQDQKSHKFGAIQHIRL